MVHDTQPSSHPHGAKLGELLNNARLPDTDRERVQAAIERYKEWGTALSAVGGEGPARLKELVRLLNEYKRSVELDLIWDSTHDFLFRQRGQIKLDNSIIEEFLPYLFTPELIPELAEINFDSGPKSSYAATYFALAVESTGGGMQIRRKDQDFTLGRPVFLRASHNPAFPPDETLTASTYLALVAAESKTNLDKTMFQEASATAHDLRIAVPGSRYFLICEWLDMTPISTAGTDIDAVLILRGKRLGSNHRANFATHAGRLERRDWYAAFLDANPVREQVLARFVEMVRGLLTGADLVEDDVLQRGYF